MIPSAPVTVVTFSDEPACARDCGCDPSPPAIVCPSCADSNASHAACHACSHSCHAYHASRSQFSLASRSLSCAFIRSIDAMRSVNGPSASSSSSSSSSPFPPHPEPDAHHCCAPHASLVLARFHAIFHAAHAVRCSPHSHVPPPTVHSTTEKTLVPTLNRSPCPIANSLASMPLALQPHPRPVGAQRVVQHELLGTGVEVELTSAGC